jgi:hypothetical protein
LISLSHTHTHTLRFELCYVGGTYQVPYHTYEATPKKATAMTETKLNVTLDLGGSFHRPT